MRYFRLVRRSNFETHCLVRCPPVGNDSVPLDLPLAAAHPPAPAPDWVWRPLGLQQLLAHPLVPAYSKAMVVLRQRFLQQPMFLVALTEPFPKDRKLADILFSSDLGARRQYPRKSACPDGSVSQQFHPSQAIFCETQSNDVRDSRSQCLGVFE